MEHLPAIFGLQHMPLARYEQIASKGGLSGQEVLRGPGTGGGPAHDGLIGARAAGGRSVLDLLCGAGRIAFHLARAPLQKVQTGEKLHVKAGDRNAFIDAAIAEMNRRNSQRQLPHRKPTSRAER